MTATLKQIQATDVLLPEYQRDPVRFVREMLGKDPWSKQEEILYSIRDNKRTSVRSCHGAGKTSVAAMAALWHLFCFPASIVVTTAPSWHQVEHLLWREIRSAHEAADHPRIGRIRGVKTELPPLGGMRFVTRLEIATNWYALGLSTDKPERFAGLHAEHLMLIVDEASGVDQAIFSAAEGFLTSPGARVLLIGNPTQLSGEFYNSFKGPQASLYNRIHISAFDSPNVTGESSRPYLVSQEWIDEHRTMWGEDSPLWYSRVLGEFPEQAEDALVALSWVEAAMRREAEPPDDAPCILGVDVARFGGDSSIIAVRRGDAVTKLLETRKADTMGVAGWVIHHAQEENATEIRIDADGIGAGVFDRLKEQGFNVVEMRGGMSARDTEQFANARAEWYWGLRERLDTGQGATMALPKDDVLMGELTALKVQYTSRGQVKIESKDDMRRRGLKSPDKADALMYAFAPVHTARTWVGIVGSTSKEARGMIRGTPVAMTDAGLPRPMDRRKTRAGAQCPQCGEALSIRNGSGLWQCERHGWVQVK